MPAPLHRRTDRLRNGEQRSWRYAEADISGYAGPDFTGRFLFASHDTEPLCHPDTAGW